MYLSWVLRNWKPTRRDHHKAGAMFDLLVWMKYDITEVQADNHWAILVGYTKLKNDHIWIYSRIQYLWIQGIPSCVLNMSEIWETRLQPWKIVGAHKRSVAVWLFRPLSTPHTTFIGHVLHKFKNHIFSAWKLVLFQSWQELSYLWYSDSWPLRLKLTNSVFEIWSYLVLRMQHSSMLVAIEWWWLSLQKSLVVVKHLPAFLRGLSFWQ